MAIQPIPENLEDLRFHAKAGDPKAMYELVRQYPAAYDDTQRVHWIWKSADLGYGPAMMRLAHEATPAVIAAATRRLGKRVGPGGATVQDRVTEAYEHLLEWARRGDAESMFVLGSSHRTFEVYHLQTLPKAVEWLRAAARVGHPDASFELAATLYEDGLSHEDQKEGFEMLKGLGRMGHCTALHLVCHAYEVGQPKIALNADPQTLEVWVRLLVRLCGDEEGAIYPPYASEKLKRPKRKDPKRSAEGRPSAVKAQ
jgi:TPR repeat protein